MVWAVILFASLIGYVYNDNHLSSFICNLLRLDFFPCACLISLCGDELDLVSTVSYSIGYTGALCFSCSDIGIIAETIDVHKSLFLLL